MFFRHFSFKFAAPKHTLEKKLDWHLQNTVQQKEYGFLFELGLYKMLLLMCVVADSSLKASLAVKYEVISKYVWFPMRELKVKREDKTS